MRINTLVPLISLCIPTNGIIEWVFPVLDSIYAQKVDEQLFEVIVTDNGTNIDFYNQMLKYCLNHKNLIYEKTNAVAFLNEIESYKRAKGQFIKFINHRTLLLNGALLEIIDFISAYLDDKPFIYFGNGMVKNVANIQESDTFDDFLAMLSYWSSWSTGMGFWKEDFEGIKAETTFNELFPHTTILFSNRKKSKYILNNTVFLQEINDDGIPKGKYDLFFAFAVEYLAIICDLLRNHDISEKTFSKIKRENLFFIMEQYHAFVVRKKPCSYILENFNSSIEVFYGRNEAMKCYRKMRLKQIKNRLLAK